MNIIFTIGGVVFIILYIIGCYAAFCIVKDAIEDLEEMDKKIKK